MKLMRIIFLLTLILSKSVFAGEADVIAVEVKHNGNHVYQFDVTVNHDDQGWEHFANKWEVISPGGEIIATRVLRHPHVNQQPFTRSISGVEIAEDIDRVTVRAHDSVHQYGGKEKTVELLNKP